jgi:ribosomal protein S18 acetylase RimI-like enzyme
MEIRPVGDRELLAASRLTIPTLPFSDSAALNALHGAPETLGIDPRRQMVALEGDAVVGACLYVLSPGRAATVLAPVLTRQCPASLVGATACNLISAARTACRKAGAVMIQALLEDAPDTPVGRQFLAAGFQYLALLVYLELPIKRGSRPTLDTQWTVTPYRPDLGRRFSDLIIRSYVGSLDCPALDGMRAPEDVMAGHRASGEFTPEGWLLLAEGPQDAGVVLVNRAAHHPGCELVYMGAAPEFRGRGLGKELVRRAIDVAAQLNCRSMRVAVDAANAPALHLYTQAGFRVIGQRFTYYVPAKSPDAV